MRKKLRNIIENNTTVKGRLFDYFIQSLIILNLICFSIETIPNNSKMIVSVLSFIEYVSVIIFSIEYLLRIYVAKKPFKYIFSFYGLVDFLAIMPFYFFQSADLRSIRILRVFSIFKALKLVRYSKAIKRFNIASRIIKEEIILFLFAVGILIYISAVGIYHFENEVQPEAFSSLFESLWWAIVSITTVGYGDILPITVGGRVFTFFVLFIGIAVVTVPAGLVATALIQAREIEANKSEKKEKKQKKKEEKEEKEEKKDRL